MEKKKKISTPRRSEIWLVNFDPTLGAEIRKTRPALILQNDVANAHSPVTIVAAVTSQFNPPLYPTEVLVQRGEGGLTEESAILLNQIRTIDNVRLIRRVGMITSDTMIRVGGALKISLGLVEI
ncbi:MAG: growth inhibitor protein [Parcubacteria group bacterium Gr01-1014_33]|nr:MAG: growth inhibitor protein [Parcubacteria group bacterium Gr01-1014_33]